MAAVMSRTRLVLVLPFLALSPAAGEEAMNASATREFVVGHTFNYTCFDGTRGSGQIFADGSAVGAIRIFGRGQTRFLRLPPGTLYIKNEKVCATLRGLSFSPCFNVKKTTDTSFRGAISGLGFMYCDFKRGGGTQVTRRRGARHVGEGTSAGVAPSGR
jgi:hypothetical protein